MRKSSEVKLRWENSSINNPKRENVSLGSILVNIEKPYLLFQTLKLIIIYSCFLKSIQCFLSVFRSLGNQLFWFQRIRKKNINKISFLFEGFGGFQCF